MTESPLRNLCIYSLVIENQYQDSHPKVGQSRNTHILLINLSLLTGLPFLPPDTLGVSVHISFTFSNTMLQCRSKAFTLANNFRLLRHEISTCVCERTAVCRMERGPEVNSCSSSNAISYSLHEDQYHKLL